jgi:hypothetical protein
LDVFCLFACKICCIRCCGIRCGSKLTQVEQQRSNKANKTNVLPNENKEDFYSPVQFSNKKDEGQKEKGEGRPSNVESRVKDKNSILSTLGPSVIIDASDDDP